MSFAFLTLSCRCARSGHGTQGSQARLPRFVLYPPATSLLFFFFFSSFFLLFLASRPVTSRGVTRRHMMPSGLNIPGFSPGGVSWRHTTSHGVIGLKYLEPSCSAGGRDGGIQERNSLASMTLLISGLRWDVAKMVYHSCALFPTSL